MEDAADQDWFLGQCNDVVDVEWTRVLKQYFVAAVM